MTPSRAGVGTGPLVLGVLGAILAAVTSLIGILAPHTYARETEAWAVQAVGQDWANLLVVLAVLVCAPFLRRGSVPALLVWLGCLLYFLYAFAIYSFAAHFNPLFLLYVAVLGLSFYAFAGALTRLDVAVVTASLQDRPHRTGASNLLIAIGTLFVLLWLAEIVPHVLANTVPPNLTDTGLLTNPVHVLDLAFLLPAMIVVGILLRRRHPLGWLFVVPLLVFAITMGLGILSMFALSASRNLPVSLPAVILVGSIVVVSGIYTALLLRKGRTGTE